MALASKISKNLENEVKETDHFEELSNDFISRFGLVFEYRSSGNYNDLIMKLINKLMEVVNEASPD
jgi:hypothetical protein